MNILQAGTLNGRFAFVRDAQTLGPVRYQRGGWQNGDTFGLVVEYDVPNGAVTAQLARVGDADLDQDVDSADFNALIQGIEFSVGQGGTPRETDWSQGNINGDPITDGYDFFDFTELHATQVFDVLPVLLYDQTNGDLVIDYSDMAVAFGDRVTAYQVAMDDPSVVDPSGFIRTLQFYDAQANGGVPSIFASYASPLGEFFEYNPVGADAIFDQMIGAYYIGFATIQPGLSRAEFLGLVGEARWADTYQGIWGGFDLVVIPEPGTMVLIGVGASLVVSRRRAA